jgi:hypothetical protein
VSPEARDVLAENLGAVRATIERLRWLHGRLAGIFPLTAASVAALTPEQQTTCDAFLLRFQSLASAIQERVFKGLALAEDENVHALSNKDRALLMERLGAIPSAAAFAALAELRNKLAHDYPNDPVKQAERLNAAWEAAPQLTAIADGLLAYAARKGLTATDR